MNEHLELCTEHMYSLASLLALRAYGVLCVAV